MKTKAVHNSCIYASLCIKTLIYIISTVDGIIWKDYTYFITARNEFLLSKPKNECKGF